MQVRATGVQIQDLARIISRGLEAPPSAPVVYEWSADVKWHNLQTGFAHTVYKDPELTVQLKRHLHGRWSLSDHAEKLRLANWVISDWGGITANHPTTIERHLHLVEDDEPEKPWNGIASYSKVLAIADPERYAVFDCRVAVSLNAIQLMQGIHILAFKYPVGRNTELTPDKGRIGFTHIFTPEYLEDKGFVKIRPRYTYRIYTELLHAVREQTGRSILATEMDLFARAEDFSRMTRRMFPEAEAALRAGKLKS